MYDEKETADVERKLNRLRHEMIRLAMKKREGHLGSSLSILHLLYCLYSSRINPSSYDSKNLFVLSKGHASLGLYAMLNEFNHITQNDMEEFCEFNGKLGGHPHRLKHPAITASTGSLGHGFPFSVGLAMGKKIKKEEGTIYCLIGDGEVNEGTNWEAALVASHHNLGNLTCIMDMNRSGERAVSIGAISDKFTAFGFECKEVDGHNIYDINMALDDFINHGDAQKPKFLLANTVKGKGVTRMENNPEWHHKFPTEAEFFEIALELDIQ